MSDRPSAAGRVSNRELSPVKDQRSTAVPGNQSSIGQRMDKNKNCPDKQTKKNAQCGQR